MTRVLYVLYYTVGVKRIKIIIMDRTLARKSGNVAELARPEIEARKK